MLLKKFSPQIVAHIKSPARRCRAVFFRVCRLLAAYSFILLFFNLAFPSKFILARTLSNHFYRKHILARNSFNSLSAAYSFTSLTNYQTLATTRHAARQAAITCFQTTRNFSFQSIHEP